MVDDQPAKLLSYEVMLGGLGEKLIKAHSVRKPSKFSSKTDVAVVLMDVSMPELDGFQLAAMIRQHPRFSAHCNHFCLRRSISPSRPAQRLRAWRGGLHFGSGGSRTPACESESSPTCTGKRGCSKL